ncbi:MAG: hypothetical protein JXA20_14710 [Spirochaetes bacterium]|nr:hypothetical protein [Spirochaetota bacterium]
MTRRNTLCCLAILLLFALPCGCAREGTVMARYGNREITRGMLVRWLQGRSDDVDAVMSRKEEQRRKLKRLALELITVDEAKRAGYDRNEDFLFLLRFVERNFCADYYWKTLSRDGWYEGDVVRVREYAVTPGDGPAPDALAREIIGELRSGVAPEAVLRHTGGRVKVSESFLARGDRGEDYDRVVFHLGHGAVAPEPVVTAGTTAVVVLLQRLHPDRDTIGDLIGDSGDRRAVRKSLLSRAREGMESRLLRAGGVWDNTAAADSADPTTVLFRASGEQFTVSDLSRVLRLVYMKKNGMLHIRDIPAKIRHDWARSILLDTVLFNEALGRGVCATEAYREAWEVNRQHSLAAGYLDDIVLSSVMATEAEARRDYDKMLAIMRRARIRGGTPSAGSGLVPFHRAKDAILAQIRDRKRMESRTAWESELLRRARFSIVESALGGY